ncbi:glycosyltransferase [Kibdelosporangium lantanae]|uniref:Glycosyltransferase n=1 Tax=Kibdelosporangium lantanae TaxID=1497396 RepID=A0ABW3M6N1_9PSEU
MLPSRVEGFGLVALEAIAQGTPVLVSDRSGVAETLREHLGRLAEPMIVRVTDSLDVDVPAWTSAIQQVLDDPEDAFDYAFTVRARLCYRLRWDNVADTLLTRACTSRPARPGGPRPGRPLGLRPGPLSGRSTGVRG